MEQEICKSEDIKFCDEVKALDEKFFNIIEEYATGGYLKSIALSLVYLSGKNPEKVQSVIGKFPSDAQNKIRDFMKDKSNEDDDVLSVTASILSGSNFSSLDDLADYRSLSKDVSTAVLDNQIKSLIKTNPILAFQLTDNLFKIEDLVALDDRSIQRVLREVDTADLVKALKNNSVAVQKKIFSNMSKRAASMLQEDMEFYGPVLVEDCIESEEKICKIVKQLIANGEIVHAKGLVEFVY